MKERLEMSIKNLCKRINNTLMGEGEYNELYRKFYKYYYDAISARQPVVHPIQDPLGIAKLAFESAFSEIQGY